MQGLTARLHMLNYTFLKYSCDVITEFYMILLIWWHDINGQQNGMEISGIILHFFQQETRLFVTTKTLHINICSLYSKLYFNIILYYPFFSWSLNVGDVGKPESICHKYFIIQFGTWVPDMLWFCIELNRTLAWGWLQIDVLFWETSGHLCFLCMLVLEIEVDLFSLSHVTE